MSGETAITDVEAASSYLQVLTKKVKEGSFSRQQVFNLEETALHWQKMPFRPFIAREEKSMPAFKASKDKQSLISHSSEL